MDNLNVNFVDKEINPHSFGVNWVKKFTKMIEKQNHRNN